MEVSVEKSTSIEAFHFHVLPCTSIEASFFHRIGGSFQKVDEIFIEVDSKAKECGRPRGTCTHTSTAHPHTIALHQSSVLRYSRREAGCAQHYTRFWARSIFRRRRKKNVAKKGCQLFFRRRRGVFSERFFVSNSP